MPPDYPRTRWAVQRFKCNATIVARAAGYFANIWALSAPDHPPSRWGAMDELLGAFQVRLCC
jgi:hypothetical protein